MRGDESQILKRRTLTGKRSKNGKIKNFKRKLRFSYGGLFKKRRRSYRKIWNRNT